MKAHAQLQGRNITEPKPSSTTLSIRRVGLELLGLLIQTWEPGVDSVSLCELPQTNFRYLLVEPLYKA